MEKSSQSEMKKESTIKQMSSKQISTQTQKQKHKKKISNVFTMKKTERPE